MFSCNEMKSKIENKLENSQVKVWNTRNDDEHFAIEVIWEGFKDKTLIQQHRIVYDILKEEFEMGIHSVSLQTKIK